MKSSLLESNGKSAKADNGFINKQIFGSYRLYHIGIGGDNVTMKSYRSYMKRRAYLTIGRLVMKFHYFL